ncbi:MAG: hemerythrin domain-containing protein [Oligoflexia bacterium]|nr:hemerythrin domain-containing protein [Oligoflexia bacterium]
MMKQLTWNQKFDCGINEINQQHEEIFFLINQLIAKEQVREQVQEQEKELLIKSEINQLLQLILEKLVRHFNYEENLFISFKFPQSKIHQEIHNLFMDMVRDFIHDYIALGPNEPPIIPINQFIDYLSKWFIEHIIGPDKEYAQFISKASQV